MAGLHAALVGLRLNSAVLELARSLLVWANNRTITAPTLTEDNSLARCLEATLTVRCPHDRVCSCVQGLLCGCPALHECPVEGHCISDQCLALKPYPWDSEHNGERAGFAG